MMRVSGKVALPALLLTIASCEIVKVTAPDVVSISVSSPAPSVAVGSTVTLQASLTDALGRPLSRDVQWILSGPQLAVVSSGGASVTVRGVSVGAASVRAEAEGVSSAALSLNVENGPAVVTSLSPESATVGSASITLTVTGTGFVSGAVIVWNNVDRATTFVSATQVRTSVSDADLATAGTYQVSVRNPAPGGGSGGAATFTVNNPTPVITTVTPSNRIAGSAAFTLTVSGSSFINGARVRWNGVFRATNFVNATTLTAAILASDIAAAGTAAVTVVNPAPSTPSNTVNVTIRVQAAPVVTTEPAINIAATTASLRGTVAQDGAPYTGWLEFATNATLTNPSTSQTITGPDPNCPGTLTCVWTWAFTGLTPNTTYYYRMVAQNAAGTSRGIIRSFTTLMSY
jgi:hypothetical protein